LLLEQLFLLFHELPESLVVLAARLFLEALRFSKGNGFLAVEFEPGAQLVVQDLPGLEDEVTVAEHLLGEAIVELLDLRDLCRPQKD